MFCSFLGDRLLGKHWARGAPLQATGTEPSSPGPGWGEAAGLCRAPEGRCSLAGPAALRPSSVSAFLAAAG